MNVSIRVKSHLSGYFASSAALFSRQSNALEQVVEPSPVDEKHLMEHRSYAIGAVISAAAYIEASINELFLAAIDRNGHIFPPERMQVAELMGHIWPDVEMRMSVLTKYQVALTLGRAQVFAKGEGVYQAADGLLHLRNALVHYKPEWHTDLQVHADIEKRLIGRFSESAFAHQSQAFFPHRCLGHGCAAWSTRTALVFYTEFAKRLAIKTEPLHNPEQLPTE